MKTHHVFLLVGAIYGHAWLVSTSPRRAALVFLLKADVTGAADRQAIGLLNEAVKKAREAADDGR